ncbi:MAG TPA: hypothetical protein VNF73_03540, partial [Candidatus Saccharimonadales bacterium]|nr:hypothetical protein [Candidatus Saccharimonadales bacterium]
MRLFELAYFCGLYGCLTRYDVSLRALRTLGDTLDPYDAKHRAALFAWLNDWGCRQFAIEHHSTTAARSLIEWSDLWLDKLPSQGVQLVGLSDAELERSAAAHEDLRACIASTRLLRSGRSSTVTFGSVGAAKVLFALRPNAFPP